MAKKKSEESKSKDKSKMSFVERALHIGGQVNATPMKVQRLSTGSLVMDYYLEGGLPQGDASEFWGVNNSGKTTTALIVAKQPGIRTAWFNIENQTTLREWGTRLGVDWSRFMELKFPTAEQYAEMIVEAIRSGEFDLVVIDSIAMMSFKSETEIDLQDKSQAQMGMGAKVNTLLMRLMTSAMTINPKAHVIMVNQLRDKLTTYGGHTSPGGHAVHHKPCFSLKFQKVEEDWADGKAKMNLRQLGIRMQMTKSKAGTFRAGEFGYPLTFLPDGRVEVDIIDEVFTMAGIFGLFRTTKGEVWTGGNGNILYEGVVLGNGESAARRGLREMPDLFEAIYSDIQERNRNGGQPVGNSNSASEPDEEAEYNGEPDPSPELELF